MREWKIDKLRKKYNIIFLPVIFIKILKVMQGRITKLRLHEKSNLYKLFDVLAFKVLKKITFKNYIWEGIMGEKGARFSGTCIRTHGRLN